MNIQSDTKRVLLIDGDTLGYRACCSVVQEHQWDDCNVSLTVDIAEALNYVVHAIEDVKEFTMANAVRVFFSGPREHSFRRKLNPGYKLNRGSKRKLLGLGTLKNVLSGIYKCDCNDKLEADDLISMQATTEDGNDYVIVANDKDYFTVPGSYINHTKLQDGIRFTSPDEAKTRHLVQTLTGDRVDNYFGCPGIGARKAESIAAQGWNAVVEAYKDAGKTEADALLNARMAYLLRHGDLDSKGKVKLWKPTV